ncbi:MAG: hypothetical protein PW792_01235 [Acidobacteriaceae bacterium]|nr:hypothetical protein [Acidobacteriaceae bacterium]
MKLLTCALGALLLQSAASMDAPPAEPAHLRFERAINISPGLHGTTCAVLDATTFAHAENRAGNDLRLYRNGTVETAYALTESSAATSEPVAATVQNLGMTGDAIAFDLAMPSRPYSAVNLVLNAHDFVATAEVTGIGLVAHSTPIQLGTFTLFDLTAQHLSRSTTLPLAEETFPTLHVVLHFTALDGKPKPLPVEVLTGATVPPSREAQTVYTTVVETSTLHQEGSATVARLNIPAHVPVERLSVELPAEFHTNFVRNVVLRDVTRHDDGSHGEELSGEISRVQMPARIPGASPIHSEHLSVSAVLAANMDDAATIELRVQNANDAPLPITRVALQMRQRRLCFDAAPGSSYTLRYGDKALAAPVYDYARLFQGGDVAAAAWLGPEQPNPAYAPRKDSRPFTERHPELLWIALLAVVAILGATAVSQVKHRSGHH